MEEFSLCQTLISFIRLKLKCDKTLPCSRCVPSSDSVFLCHSRSFSPVVNVGVVQPFVRMAVLLRGKELGACSDLSRCRRWAELLARMNNASVSHCQARRTSRDTPLNSNAPLDQVFIR